MNKEIITEKIFIDTSVFIKENFFAGIKLIALIKHAQEKKIELFTTEITLGECLSNIEKQFLQGKNLLLKTLKTLASNARILKNVEDVNEILEIGENLDSNKELAKLKEDFKELISKNFKVIPIDASKTQKIIDDYFSENPPFKGGSKKHEFPDAIVLNSLDSWCTKQKERIYNITTDEDMLSYVSKRIIPICEYDQLLNLISYTYSEENIVKKVEESLNTHSKDIIEEVEKEFENNFPSSGWDSNFGYEYYLNSFEDLNTEYINHSILSIYDNKAIVEINFKVHYSVEIGYEDLGTAFYDKEDDEYYGVERASQIVSDNLDLTVEVNVYVDLPGKPAIWDWELEEIVKGIPDDISLE